MTLQMGVLLHPAQSWECLLATAAEAEKAGWDSVWIGDHFMPTVGDEDGPMNEVWAYLAGLAVATRTLRIGSLVCGVTYRHPSVLVKQAVTVQNMSDGRLTLGLGTGWHEREHEAYGIDFPGVRERLDRLEEACEVTTRLLAGAPASFQGNYYTLDEAPLCPPPHGGRLPLLIGGGGEHRTMRIAARFADHWNFWGTPDSWQQKNSVLDDRCDEIGRDPSTIKRSCQALVYLSEDARELERLRNLQMPRPPLIGTRSEISDELGRYAAVGVEEFIVPDFTMPPVGVERWEYMAALADAAATHRS